MEMKDTRSGFGAGLTQLGKSNPNVVALCADLTGSLKMTEFKCGCAVVLDKKKGIVGILTDGDIRRIMLNSQKP